MNTDVAEVVSESQSLTYLSFNKLAQIIRTMKWEKERDSNDCEIISLGIKFLKDPNKHNLDPERMHRYVQRLETMNGVIHCGAQHRISYLECNEIADFFKNQQLS